MCSGADQECRDKNSELVKAEFISIEQTLEIEEAHAKRGWAEMVATPGMRRRVLVAAFLALAGQWSGAGLITYYQSPMLSSVGISNNQTKNIINLGLTCWSFVASIVSALYVTKFPRRRVYLVWRWSIVTLGCEYLPQGLF